MTAGSACTAVVHLFSVRSTHIVGIQLLLFAFSAYQSASLADVRLSFHLSPSKSMYQCTNYADTYSDLDGCAQPTINKARGE